MAEHEQDPKPAEASAEPEYKVFVGGISYKVDERGLKESECMPPERCRSNSSSS